MHTHTYNRQQLLSIRRNAKRLELSREACVRLSWLIFASDHDGNIQTTCVHFGIARSTFARWAKRFDPQDPFSLEEHSRRPHHVRLEETPAHIIEWVRLYRLQSPRMGKHSISELLAREHAVDVSPSTIGRIIERHGFFFGRTASHKRKRQERGLLDVTVHVFTPTKFTEHMILPLS